ncbi:MAG: benzoyl-CoA-dihydrodiol lyase [Deltaproteobacteria bacterium]|nr:benzoyl-CoA-dihydrodiol lyase [Deltaproteobacteria bacterium]
MSAVTTFETHPDRYVHFKLGVEGAIARLVLDVQQDRPHVDGYALKLNSYDLGVDIELHDAALRLRFEHPGVRAVVVSSANPRVFCAGANIMMLASSSHPFKVNFCKFTNETRCAIEEASARSSQRWIAALGGTASGGGYELALACDEIHLVDDGSSAVSLPEIPLLGVLPGTGGLTRLVDKRRVRRDLADVFSTLAEGVKARRALEWGLVDAVWPKSRFERAIADRAATLAAQGTGREGPGIVLEPLAPRVSEDAVEYDHVDLRVDRSRRVAHLTVRAPSRPPGPAGMPRDSDFWMLRVFRELDDALCRLRFDFLEVGLVLVRTTGDIDSVLATEALVASRRSDDWLAREIVLLAGRTLRRLEATAKSFFALVEPGSAFAGCLFELALACDRIYMLRDPARPTHLAVGPFSGGSLPMANGLTRLESRFLGSPERAAGLAQARPTLDAAGALEAGLCTSAPDEIDWDDEVRVAIEERSSLSPDALTAMEASLRFAGPETTETKIYGRLSAWQNWVFTRPNSTGDRGALSLYGSPERPRFDWRRT